MTAIKIINRFTRNERIVAVPAAQAHAFIRTFRSFFETATFA
jgi:hypothetical protein